MKDSRTIQNTSQDEIREILEKARLRKEKAWQKPTMCAAPECKTLFTPTREWQKYCSHGCKQAVMFQNKQKEQSKLAGEMLRLMKENEELLAENAVLRDEIKQLKGTE